MSASIFLKDVVKISKHDEQVLQHYFAIRDRWLDESPTQTFNANAQKLITSIETTFAAIGNDSLFDETYKVDADLELLQSDLNALKIQRWENFKYHLLLATQLLMSIDKNDQTVVDEINLLIQANHLIVQTIQGKEIDPGQFNACYNKIATTIDSHEKHAKQNLAANENRYEKWKNIQKNISLTILISIAITVILLSGGWLTPIIAGGIIGVLLLMQTVNMSVMLAKLMRHHDQQNTIIATHTRNTPNLDLQKNSLFAVMQTKKIEDNYQALDKQKARLERKP